jgi:hypothetical protein
VEAAQESRAAGTQAAANVKEQTHPSAERVQRELR